MKSSLGTLLTTLALGLAALLSSACGDPPPSSGSGSLEIGEDGLPDLLVVSGSPYEMGRWQGYLLKDRIRALHARWRAALLDSIVPLSDGGRGGKALRKGLDVHCGLCVDQAIHRMDETMLQELDGLAEGAGLTREGLVRLEVMRDALRMKGMEPRLVGAMGLAPLPGGHEARVWWSGPDAESRAGDLLLIRRKPDEGPETVVVGWPGSLGGLAGLSASGVGYLSAAGAVSHPRRVGFGGGLPITVSARLALDENETGHDLFSQVTGTMGHPFLAFSMSFEEVTEDDGRSDRTLRVQAMAGFHVYSAPDSPWVLGSRPFLAVGPYEVLNSPGARSIWRLHRPTSQSIAERWLQLKTHAAPRSDAPPAGPWVRVRWEGAAGTLTLYRSADGPGREVRLGAE